MRFWIIRFFLAIVIFGFALFLRVLPREEVILGDRIIPHGNDAYYHLRRIFFSVENFPSTLRFDSYLNFPEGGQAIWSPLFDWLHALLLVMIPLDLSRYSQEVLLMWTPSILGSCGVVLAAVFTWRVFGVGAACLVGFGLAVLPAHFVYSRIGYLDHHVAVSLYATWLLAFGSVLADSALVCVSKLKTVPLLVISLVLGFLLWPGCLLHISGFLFSIWLVILLQPDRSVKIRSLKIIAISLVVAALVLLPWCWDRQWMYYGGFSPVVLSLFQPLFLLLAGFFFAGTAIFYLFSSPRSRRRIILALVLVGSFCAWILVSEFEGIVQEAWRWIARDEAFQNQVSESRPLWSVSYSEIQKLFSPLIWVFPALLCFLVLHLVRNGRAGLGLFLGVYSLLFALFAVIQNRFSNSFSSIFWCVVCVSLLKLMALIWRREGAYFATGAIVMCSLALSSARYGRWFEVDYEPFAKGRIARKTQLNEVADWIRKNTEPTVGYQDMLKSPSYGVLSEWSNGHLLRYVSERPMVVDNFGDDVAPENFVRVKEYYQSSPDRASSILENLEVRYVLFEFRPGRENSVVDPGSIFSRLYFFDGGASFASLGGVDGNLEIVKGAFPAVSNHRLVYETAPKRGVEGAVRAAFKLYEVVSGAGVEGMAIPNTAVAAHILLKTQQGRVFKYRAATISEDSGRYWFRLPYSTDGLSSHVLSISTWQVSNAGIEKSLRISEESVVRGKRVSGPNFLYVKTK